MKSPLVSIIIPCYNASEYINDCLESCINQTYQNIEVICVDDHSEDNTLNILSTFSNQHANIKVYSNPKKGGNEARNHGLSQATGEFIQFLDADDILLNEKLSEQVAAVDNNTDLVLCNYEIRDFSTGEVLRSARFSECTNNFLECAITRIIITNNPIYRNSFLDITGGYLEGLQSAQDWEFHIRIAIHNPKVKHVNKVLFYNRATAGSVSSNWKSVSLNQCEIVFMLKGHLLASNSLTSAAGNYIAQLYYNTIIHSASDHKHKIQNLLEEYLFWSKMYPQHLTPLKRTLKRLFGLKFLLWLDKKRL